MDDRIFSQLQLNHHQATISHLLPVASPQRSKNGPRLHGMATGLAATMAANWKETPTKQPGGGVNGIPDVLFKCFGVKCDFFLGRTWKDHIVDQHKFYIIGSMRDSNSILLRLNYGLICFGRLRSTYTNFDDHRW